MIIKLGMRDRAAWWFMLKSRSPQSWQTITKIQTCSAAEFHKPEESQYLVEANTHQSSEVTATLLS